MAPTPSDSPRHPWPAAASPAFTERRGLDFTSAYTDAVDNWLREAAGLPVPGVTIAAVGGYGRRQLCPGSDLDVMILHDDVADVGAIADRVLYPLWDSGVRVDHSVRSVRDALRLADAELEVAVGLFDARSVWGEAALVDRLVSGAVQQWVRLGTRRVAELADLVAARHQRVGEVAFMLEPDLKQDRGGLRDVTVLRAPPARGSPVVTRTDDLVIAERTLLAVRVELQRLTGRPHDKLVLDYQDAVAAALRYADADALMAAVAAAGRQVARIGDDSWRRVRSWVAGPRGRQGSADRPLGPGLARRDDEVIIVGDADPGVDASLAWRAAAIAAEQQLPFSRSALRRLASDQPVIDAPWPPAARNALVALLATGRPAIAVFEELDGEGLLERLLPEWGAVRSKPQRNAFHRFTVDRHLCETAAEAAQLTREVGRPDLLLIGAWLHDIGKGFRGDHTEVGIRVVARIADRLGFDPDDTATLVAMVEHHLLLPDVATRRDIADPRVVERVAEAVGDRERLRLLGALAIADGRATGPAAWSPWKADLVATLVANVESLLAGRAPAPLPAPLDRVLGVLPEGDRAAVAEALSAGEIAVTITASGLADGAAGATVTIVAPDRRGLLALLAGVFTVNRLTVLDALCAPAPGRMAADGFVVESATGEPIDHDRVTRELVAALRGDTRVDLRVAERERAYAGRPRRAARSAESRVAFEDNGESTTVEVRAVDDVGLLYRLALAVADLGLAVRSARVATLGHEVVDTFAVVTEGGKPAPRELWPTVEQALLAACPSA